MSNEMTNQPAPPEQPPATAPEHYVGAPSPPPPAMSFVDKFVGILTEPPAFFAKLALKPEWLTPFLTISILTLVLNTVMVPKMIQLVHIAANEAAAMGGQPTAEKMHELYRILYVRPVLAFAYSLVVWLIESAVLLLITLVARASTEFKMVWTLVVWASFPTIFGIIVGSVYLLTLKALPTSTPSWGVSFQVLMLLWELVLVYEGLVHMLRMKSVQARFIVIVYGAIVIPVGLLLVSQRLQ